MHMADGLISPAVSAAMYVLSGTAAVYSVRKLREDNDKRKVPLMGVMSAFVFAAQMINFTIPGTGSSGHICGGMLLCALLGPYAGFLSMIAILLIQCLIFADGGILALGANIWNMAFYACFVGYFCIYVPITKKAMTKTRIAAASILGSVISLQLGAFSVVLETLCSRITDLSFGIFAAAMQPIHLAIGLGEGLITATVLISVYSARPELLNTSNTENKISYKKLLAVLGVTVVLIGGGLSLFASQNPDGLEWSIEKVTGDTEVETDGKIYDSAKKIQDSTSVIADYSIGDNAGSGSIAGIIGSCAVGAVCIGGCLIIKKSMR